VKKTLSTARTKTHGTDKHGRRFKLDLTERPPSFEEAAVALGLTSYEGGATRTPKAERRELIPKTAIDALARRLAMGAEKHGVNNWRKGGAEFRLATVNHILDHLFDYLENGNTKEANTDAIICNAAFLCEYEAKLPYDGVTQ
jgi:hypothetical protein